MNEEERKKKWLAIEDKIDLYRKLHPDGSMKQFFESQPKGTRSAYYCYKPKDYNWPGQRVYNKGENKHRSDKTHNRYFKRMTGWTYKEVYQYQQTIGLDPDKVPEDWDYMKEKYLRLLVALKDPVEDQEDTPKEVKEKHSEIPMFELPDYRDQPMVQEEVKATFVSSSTDGNRDKLQAIMRVYEQTIQAIKELS